MVVKDQVVVVPVVQAVTQVVVEIHMVLHPAIEHLVVHMAVVQVLMHHLELVAINCINGHVTAQLLSLIHI